VSNNKTELDGKIATDKLLVIVLSLYIRLNAR